MAGAYRVKDWHQIRQALPGAGAELVVLVPVSVLPVLVPVSVLSGAELPVLVPVSVLIWRCWSFWC